MGSRILLADDSITIQKVVNLTFADEGIEVVAVSNGEAAERRLAEIKPDLVLADIFMPGKNGYELCEFIKQHSHYRAIPVVLLVGAFEPFDQAEARRVKADAHLTKPFESRTLVETVRKLITASGRPTTGPIAPPQPAEEETQQPSAPAPAAAQPAQTAQTAHLAESAPAERAAPQMSAPRFNIDLAAMTEELPPVEGGTGQTTAAFAGFGALNETAPLDIDYGSLDQEEYFSPVDIEVTTDSHAVEASSLAAAPPARQTGELASAAPADQVPVNTDGLSMSDFSLSDPLDSPDLAFGEPATDHVVSRAGSEVPSRFADVSQDIVLDFDRLDAPESHRGAGGPSFEVDMDESFESDEGFAAPEVKNLNTRVLEMPPVAVGSSSAAAQAPEQAQTFGEQHEVGFEFSDQPAEMDSPSLLAVDDPLGDILMDEAPRAGDELTDRSFGDMFQVLQPQAERQTTEGALELEFMPQESSAAPQPSFPSNGESAQSRDLPLETPLVLEEPFGSPAHLDERTPTTSPLESPEQESAQGAIDFEQVETHFDTVAPTGGAGGEPEADSFGWAGHETGFAEPKFDGAMEADFQMQPARTAPEHNEPPSVEADARFTASSMWVEQESRVPADRFAPIDIEAVPVTEEAAEASTPASPAATAREASAAGTAQPADTQAASQSPEEGAARSHETGSEVQDFRLPPAVIDEIVRRVVAEMSQAVVREIAWEVVPDSVERVIEKLTRESLAKRM